MSPARDGGRRARRRRVLRGTAALVAAGVAAAVVTLAAAPGHDHPPAPAATPAAAPLHVPAPARPAFVPGALHAARAPGTLSHWAPVRRAVDARTRPGAEAPVVGRLETTTPEGTDTLVPVLDRRGGAWVRVGLPVLPNGTTGWVPRTALGGYGTADTLLTVDRRRLRATLTRGAHVLLRVPVAVGTPDRPTPAGTFLVRNRLTRYASPAYGPIAFGTSARSPTATDWPAGGFVGIHGTDRPDLVPGRVSHGCIRLRNADIRALARRMPVGTPVRIV